jgi:hypothetical protein
VAAAVWMIGRPVRAVSGGWCRSAGGGRGRGRGPQLEQVVGVVQQLPLGLRSGQAPARRRPDRLARPGGLHSDGLKTTGCCGTAAGWNATTACMSSTTGPRCSPRPATTGWWPFGTPTDRQGQGRVLVRDRPAARRRLGRGLDRPRSHDVRRGGPAAGRRPQDDDRSERTHRLLPCAHLRRVFVLVAFIGGAWALRTGMTGEQQRCFP